MTDGYYQGIIKIWPHKIQKTTDVEEFMKINLEFLCNRYYGLSEDNRYFDFYF